MKTIKQLLYKIFGLKTYLKIVSCVYIKYISYGFGKKKYAELHYLKNIIKQDFVCIDIGANLGYYSYFLSKILGNNGKLIAIEPVPLFGKIWRKNIKKSNSKNIIFYPYALGAENKNMKMEMPIINGNVRHGMTQIVDNVETNTIHNAVKTSSFTFDVEMKIPDELFASIERIDFIKMDIEGYEHIALENMKKTLIKHKPLIQAELGGKENRQKSIKILLDISYKIYVLKDNELVEIDEKDIENYGGDFYFRN